MLSILVPLKGYGSCFFNRITEGGKYTEASKVNELSKCRFYLAFENSNVEDYITEKFYNGLLATSKTIMIYNGAPNIKEYNFPKKTFISVNDFKSIYELSNYLKSLNENDNLFEDFFNITDTDVDKIVDTVNNLNKKNVQTIPCKLCTSVAETKIARIVLHRSGIVPPPGYSKVTIDQFEAYKKAINEQYNILKSNRELAILNEIYDMAYGRYWRKGNHNTNWNDIEYVHR